jgi:ABC-type lipoprotein release transport system permease subunit
MSSPDQGEVVFVVDVSAFTERGFVGSSSFAGEEVNIEFDDRNDGLVLSSAMAERIHVRAGSKVTIILENEERPQISESLIKSVGAKLRISDEKTYYFVGRTGGAVIRVRKK